MTKLKIFRLSSKDKKCSIVYARMILHLEQKMRKMTKRYYDRECSRYEKIKGYSRELLVKDINKAFGDEAVK